MPADCAPAIPLSDWANRQLRSVAAASCSAELERLTGAQLLGERALLGGFRVAGEVSAGGGCRLYRARDGWIALSLTRPDDRESLPALFGDGDLDLFDDDTIVARIAGSRSRDLITQGITLGLAIAAVDETPASPAVEIIASGQYRQQKRRAPPLVIDLSALWAGPLATRLLELAGATVMKVESKSRPDAMRHGDPRFFALLNGRKASNAVDLYDAEDLRSLLALLAKADIVLESSRPRALGQLGIDADVLVASNPGLVWVSVTGHGIRGEAANRIGFGDDCGVAGGLTAAMRRANGRTVFVGDAIADPLSGIVAACAAWRQWQTGQAARIIVSMSGVVAQACAEEAERDGATFQAALRDWAMAEGEPFPPVETRAAA